MFLLFGIVFILFFVTYKYNSMILNLYYYLRFSYEWYNEFRTDVGISEETKPCKRKQKCYTGINEQFSSAWQPDIYCEILRYDAFK